jgi:hypothetical protein
VPAWIFFFPVFLLLSISPFFLVPLFWCCMKRGWTKRDCVRS